jgi:hypothetical protein
MKKLVLFLVLLSLGIYANGQEFPKLKQIKLNKKAHYKAAEETTYKVVNYLFETPIDRKNKSRSEAGQFLLDWMHGTPDYTFNLEEKELNFFNTDSDLMLMYMAALTKFALENPAIKDPKDRIVGALRLVLPYLNQQENKKSWSAALWQLNEANQKGNLLAYLNDQR